MTDATLETRMARLRGVETSEERAEECHVKIVGATLTAAAAAAPTGTADSDVS